MSENERMICEMQTKELYHGTITRWVAVEPAPPKGWRPWCAHGASVCNGIKAVAIGASGYAVDLNELKEECQQCPWRKKDGEKQ